MRGPQKVPRNRSGTAGLFTTLPPPKFARLTVTRAQSARPSQQGPVSKESKLADVIWDLERRSHYGTVNGAGEGISPRVTSRGRANLETSSPVFASTITCTVQVYRPAWKLRCVPLRSPRPSNSQQPIQEAR
jgi:hypothetical protein